MKKRGVVKTSMREKNNGNNKHGKLSFESNMSGHERNDGKQHYKQHYTVPHLFSCLWAEQRGKTVSTWVTGLPACE